MQRTAESELVVVMSTSELVARTNPFSTMLVTSLNSLPGVQAYTFSWKRALVGRYDVLHLHWPESRLEGSTATKAVAKQALFTLVVVRAKLLRRPIVRTVHNIELPQGVARRKRWILRLAERWTALRIRLNTDTPLPTGPSETIKHGHYREWFANYPVPHSVPGRIAFVGLIRRYKAVPELARAFADTIDAGPDLTLRICGHPSSEELAEALTAVAREDSRISLLLRRIDDAELVEELGQAELVVLPYPEMHNSGAVLTSLSLGRPVLVPDNEVNRALADEVGPGWLQTFVPPLTGEHLLVALARVHGENLDVPRLDSRDWATIADAHERAYRRAVGLVARRRTAR